MIKAECKHVSVVDYRKGLGHTEELSIGAGDGAEQKKARTDQWGAVAVKPALAGEKKTSSD